VVKIALLSTVLNVVGSAILLIVPLLGLLLPFAVCMTIPAVVCCSMNGGCRPSSRSVPEGNLLPASPVSPGAKGPGVAQLQHALIELGHMDASAIRFCAGMFGPRTTGAIRKLQRALAMEPTGCFDRGLHDHIKEQLTTQRSRATTADSVHHGLSCDASGSSKRAFLLELGFEDKAISEAFQAAGSWETTANWLLETTDVRRADSNAEADATPHFPSEWEGFLRDCIDMGFTKDASRSALQQSHGDVKQAVKALVEAEREGK